MHRDRYVVREKRQLDSLADQTKVPLDLGRMSAGIERCGRDNPLGAELLPVDSAVDDSCGCRLYRACQHRHLTCGCPNHYVEDPLPLPVCEVHRFTGTSECEQARNARVEQELHQFLQRSRIDLPFRGEWSHQWRDQPI